MLMAQIIVSNSGQQCSQKDERRPNDPGYDPRTLYIPPGAWKSFTPFEKQASSIFKVDVAFVTVDNDSFSSGRSV